MVAQPRVIRLAGQGEYACAGAHRELGREDADSAGRAGDDDRVGRRQPQGVDRGDRRGADDVQAAGLLEGQPVGLGCELPGRDRDELGMRGALVGSGASPSFADAYLAMTASFNAKDVGPVDVPDRARVTPTTFEAFATRLAASVAQVAS